MKTFNSKIIKLSVFLGLIFFFGQTVLSSQCPERISHNDILAKLTSSKAKSLAQLNEELINEVLQRKVDFELTENKEKSLRFFGANDLLIKTIRENRLEKSELEEDSKKLYEMFINSEKKPDSEEINRILEFSKIYVNKYEHYECEKEIVRYLKESIPVLEKQLSLLISNKERIEKNNEKYKYLEKITTEYKSKNWKEVFALGEKVLEIDPEFMPLIIVLAGVGFDQAKLKGEKSEFNDKTVRYAELAVKLLEAEKETQSKYGALDYEYKTKAEALEKMKQILDFIKNQNLYKAAPDS